MSLHCRLPQRRPKFSHGRRPLRWPPHTVIVGLVAAALASSGLALGSPSDAMGQTSEPTAPTVSLSAPTAGRTVSGKLNGGSACEATAKSSTAAINRVEFSVDGRALNVERTGPYNCYWDTLTSTDGPHRLEAKATDSRGVSSTVSVEVNVQNAPTISYVAPTPGQTVSGKLNGGSACEATAKSTTASIDRVEFSVDGHAVNVERSAPYNCIWDTKTSTDGSHRLDARAVDTKGRSTTASVEVRVENAVPTATPGTTPSTTAPGEVLWSGDAETGDLSQWSKATYNCGVSGTVYIDAAHCSDRIQVVTSPTSGPHSRYAYRFEVRDGDTSSYGGERNEIKQTNADKLYPRGSDRYFGYSVRLPGSFPSDNQGVSNDWTALSEWKTLETHASGPAAINMQTGDDQLNLKHASSPMNYLWRTPFAAANRDVWQRFVVHVTFDSDASKGSVEMWQNGQLVLPKTPASTMETYNGFVDPTYSKIGYYRNAAISGTSQVYVDDYRVGTSYSAVAPPSP